MYPGFMYIPRKPWKFGNEYHDGGPDSNIIWVSLHSGGDQKMVEFQYPEIVHNHYKFCDMIDNHNSFRMHLISMEETWMTMRWDIHVFCFLLVVTIVNIQNAAVYFLNKPKLDALQSQ